MNKKLLIIFIAVVVVMIIGVLIVKFSHTPSIISNQKITGTITSSSASMSSINQASCLSDNEYADYPLDPEYATSTLSPKLPVTISVRDKNTHQIKFTFQIDNAYAQLSHPLELLKCGVYIIRLFNFDMKTFQQLPGFRVALWKYDYMGHGSELIPLDGTDSSGAQLVSYAYDFNIDPQEKYLVLDDQEPIIYGLVVKDLKSMDNILTTKLADLNRQYPSVTGDFDLGSWTPDGKHLVGSVYDGALDTAYYRIEVGTWKVQIFPSPPELRSGVERVMNYEGG